MEDEFILEKYENQCQAIERHVDWSKIKSVLEIGFGAGHSARYFLSHSDVKVTSFELNQREYTIRKKQVIDEQFPGRHEMIWGDSTMTLPQFPTRMFDLIFINGSHGLERSSKDIVNCMRFSRPDTIVITPDVSYEPELTQAWQEFVRISVIHETFRGQNVCIGRYLVFHNFSVPRPKVVDAFMFYNELDMLRYRLTVMGPYIDRFIICECPVSFAGKPKPLYFQENKHLFEPWLDKITHLVWKGYRETVETLEDSWYNENNQRNYLLEGLRDLKPNDIVIISDLDEIIDPQILEIIDLVLGHDSIVKFAMDLYYYNIETRCPHLWDFSRAARYKFVRDVTPHFCRNSHRKDPVIHDAGWHLSFFGNEKFIINKTKNYAHIEAQVIFNEDDIDKVREIVNQKADFTKYFNTSDVPRVIFEHVPKDRNTRLPPRLDILPHQVI